MELENYLEQNCELISEYSDEEYHSQRRYVHPNRKDEVWLIDNIGFHITFDNINLPKREESPVQIFQSKGKYLFTSRLLDKLDYSKVEDLNSIY